eukprot:TRINITY_DN5720_c0_g1_i1.p1 TRINITY_DN5720_c0_g1~~TRINITY_DN5720_c0_g1_i1.p1  ORF type:complete len:311 (+),score=40.76 TRINITY_DN5720_c0_g1_i1:75-1007(+)
MLRSTLCNGLMASKCHDSKFHRNVDRSMTGSFGYASLQARGRCASTSTSDGLVTDLTAEVKFNIKAKRRFWSDKAERRVWLAQSGAVLGVQTLSDWYKIKSDQLLRIKNSSLLKKYYRASLYAALKDLHPEHQWHPWLFQSRMRSVWNLPEVRRDFFDWTLREVLHRQSLEDWYQVKYRDLVQQLKQRGVPITAIQNYCGGSFVNALKETYPAHEWQEWRFAKVPKGFWKDLDNRKRYFNWVGQQLKLQTREDWYGVTYNQVAGLGANGILQSQYNSSLSEALADVYPDHAWSSINFSSKDQSNQLSVRS